MKKLSRKEFIKNTALATGALMAFHSCKNESAEIESPNIISKKHYEWKMVTTWPPNFPVLGEGCVAFAQWVEAMSGGRMKIKVYGGGELIPALQAFEAVNSGAVEIANGASYYWAGINPATQFFTTVPFGMNAQQVNAWLYQGGGLDLWTELYAEYNLKPFPGGNTGVQMAGWFNKEIKSIEDFKGLKMRIPGLGGKVLNEVGGTAVLSAGSEIYTNLERGVIDATEWIGPYHDYKMGFQNIAKYYYAPGWHEPGSNLEFMFNKREFDKLPLDLQTILEVCAAKLNLMVLSEFEAKNNIYLQKIKDESPAEVKILPKDVLNHLKNATDTVLRELIERDRFSRKVFESYSKFKTNIMNWSNISERLYYNDMNQL
ncbi:MAG TPA: TRAP transporter substrate-binding protein DctP [Saprospiraceae bacterium]|nr:TRAP transporter substrate-binding protein DctP [Saprospiraceae bacterium]